MTQPLHQEQPGQDRPNKCCRCGSWRCDGSESNHHGSEKSEPGGTDSTWTVYGLNNRACVSVLGGNFAIANHCFEVALEEHKHIGEMEAAAEAASLRCPCHCHFESTGLSARDDEDVVCPMADGDTHYDYDNDYDMDVEYSFHEAFSTDSVSLDQVRIQRLTTTSTVRIPSFAGKEDYREQQQQQHPTRHSQSLQVPDDPDFFHQIYCLPIVLDHEEWKLASMQDKSFVLIFNTALSHHLWGMRILAAQQQQQQRQKQNHHHDHRCPEPTLSSSRNQEECLDDDLCRRLLWTARTLYRLALGSLSTFVPGVDKLCYLAVFNNLSHVCKTLDGPRSVDAYCLDHLLLKSIFWWRETTKSARPTATATATATAAAAAATAASNLLLPSARTRPETSAGQHSYRDEDSQVVDSFLENVFYLIGAPETAVPAAAA